MLGASFRCSSCGRKVAAHADRCPRCGGIPVDALAPPGDAAPLEPGAVLKAAIDDHVRRGFRVVSQTETTAQLVRPKRFRFVLALVLALISFGLLFLLYLLWYVAQRDQQVYLRVDEDGRLHRR